VTYNKPVLLRINTEQFDIIYRTLFYVNIYGNYKLSKTVRFLAHPDHLYRRRKRQNATATTAAARHILAARTILSHYKLSQHDEAKSVSRRRHFIIYEPFLGVMKSMQQNELEAGPKLGQTSSSAMTERPRELGDFKGRVELRLNFKLMDYAFRADIYTNC